MRKGLWVALFVVGLGFSESAFAEDIKAELVELDESGQPKVSLSVFSLAMHKRRSRVTAFTFKEIFGTKCPPGAFCILGFWELERNFKVIGKRQTSCGSSVYVAEYRENKKARKVSRLEVMDNSTRVCDDFRPYQWEVALVENGVRRRFGGNPKLPVEQKACNEIAANTICTMQFDPSVCVAGTLDGEPLAEPINASGGNPCFAEAMLKVAACERGLDWEKLRDEDVACAPEN